MKHLNKTSRPLLKICGITRLEDVAACEFYGVDFIGLNFWKGSPRVVGPDTGAKLAREVTGCQVVGVCVDAPVPELVAIYQKIPQITVWQLHGSESLANATALQEQTGCHIWKAIKLRTQHDVEQIDRWRQLADLILLDGASPGSGQRFEWEWLPGFSPPTKWGLAGGLNPNNLDEALQHKPTLIDIASGVESLPGIKDHRKIAQCVRLVREASV